MTPEQIAADLLRQEHHRLRARVAFFHGCAGDAELRRESREACRMVADRLGMLVAGLALIEDQLPGAPSPG